MDNLMENIQKVMSDPESMKQISELAQMLGLSGEEKPPSPPPCKKTEPEFDFSKLFSTQPEEKKTEGDVDFNKILQLSKIFESASKPDKNTQLILALKPHLKEESQKKADRLVKIFKLMAVYPVLKESGLVGGDLSGIL